MMRELIMTRATAVWLVLMTATAVSWWLAGSSAGHGGGTAMLCVAFFKVRLVVMDFMEARHAPGALRWTSETILALVCSLVLVFYLYGPALVAAGFPVD